MVWVTTVLVVHTACADNPLNGSSPRPFYVFAHNPNSVAEAEAALNAGANALEPDVTLGWLDFGTQELCPGSDLLGNLVDWDSSDPNRPGSCVDTRLVDWLDGVHDLAIKYQRDAQGNNHQNNLGNELALVVFDIKSAVADSASAASYGLVILEAIRNHLNTNGVNVNVILSVATRSDGAIFDYLLGSQAVVQLGAREGVQIDSEDDVGSVIAYFRGRGYCENIAYGDGTAGLGTSLATAMDGAAGIRAATGYPRAVTYVYTLNDPDTMRLHIDAGVDGIIPDCTFPFHPPLPFCPDSETQLRSVAVPRTDIRMATREDNPFQPLNEAYALKVRTADDETTEEYLLHGSEGTDANITFTLHGTAGDATIRVNTAPPGRMESGDENWVTIPSKDLGVLGFISINNDGAGNAPDWKLLDLTVYSARWLNPQMTVNYTASLDDWIDGGSSRELALTLHMHPLADEYAWSASDQGCGDGSTTTPWKRVADANNSVGPGGTIHIASGLYAESLTLTKPCTLTFWPAHGSDPAVIKP